MNTPPTVNRPKRAYHAPRRAAAAAQTREAILSSAAEAFGSRGWGGTTIRAVASAAGVSPKTVEALFATKAALLGAAVDYAIRGDAGDEPIVRREAARAIEAAPDAATALDLHARMVCAINARSAGVAAAVESAAPAHPSVAALWERMRENHRFGVRWAAEAVRGKPGLRPALTAEELEETIFLAMSWSTYRALERERGLDAEGITALVRRLYRRALLTS